MMEVDKNCLDFVNMEVIRIKVWREGPISSWEHSTVSDELSEYMVVVLPTISQVGM